MKPQADTQRRLDRLARLYTSCSDQWLSRTQVAAVVGSGSVTQRNSDLRRMGFVIDCQKRLNPRTRAFWVSYRYVSPARRKKAA